MSFRELFEQRPIWSKSALSELTGYAKEKVLKATLPYLAFYWKTGPWARKWNRWGFDPTRSPIIGRKLQSVDIRTTMEDMVFTQRKTMAKLPNLAVFNHANTASWKNSRSEKTEFEDELLRELRQQR